MIRNAEKEKNSVVRRTTKIKIFSTFPLNMNPKNKPKVEFILYRTSILYNTNKCSFLQNTNFFK